MKANSYEKAANALLFLLLLLAAWVPAWWKEWQEPYAFPPLIFFSAAMGLVAAGLLFDSAATLIPGGKAVYPLAIFLSIPLTAQAASGHSTFALTSLLLISVGALWLVSRAAGDNRRYLLGMYFAMLAAAGALFGLHPAAFVLIALLALDPAEKFDWRLLCLALLSVGIGSGLGALAGVHTSAMLVVDNKTISAQLLSTMPWYSWLLVMSAAPILSVLQRIVAVIAVGMLLAIQFAGYDSSLTTIAYTPLASIFVARHFLDLYSRPRRSLTKVIKLLPFVAAFLTALVWWIASGIEPRTVGTLQTGLLFFLLLAALTFHLVHQHRWALPFWVLCGLLLGSWSHFLPQKVELTTSSVILLAVVAALAVALSIALHRRLFGQNADYPEQDSPEQHEYGAGDFRRYSSSAAWCGEPVKISDLPSVEYRFAIFGDITGADSVISARQGGYLGFKNLVEALEREQPAFCIALGDLASAAREYPYRRARQMLRKIPQPLLVVPGNHDVMNEGQVDTRFFRGLYGADQHSFVHGPLHFVLINNAYGSLSDEQFLWVERELAANKNPTKLVFCHKPLFDPRPDKEYAMEWRPHAEHLHRLLVDHHVTAVFSGHIHTFLHENRDGVNYIISGGGGSKIVAGGAPHHYILCTVEKTALQVRALPLTSATTPLFETRFAYGA